MLVAFALFTGTWQVLIWVCMIPSSPDTPARETRPKELLPNKGGRTTQKKAEKEWRAEYSVHLKDAFLQVYQRRFESAALKCSMWLEGKAEDEGIGQADDSDEEKMGAVAHFLDADSLKLEATAFRHTAELLTFVSQKLRPTAESTSFSEVEAKEPWNLLTDNALDDFPAEQVECARRLLNAGTAPTTWKNHIGNHMKLYEHLKSTIAKFSQSQVRSIVDKLSAFKTLDLVKGCASQFAEIQKRVDALAEPELKNELTALVEFYQALDAVKAGIDRSRMGAGLGRTPGLQRQAANALSNLRKHLEFFKGALANYIEDSDSAFSVGVSAFREPLLQSAGFPREVLSNIIADAERLIQESATANQEGDLVDLKKACVALNDKIALVPDATASEKQFTKHMSSRGTNLNDQAKNLEKMKERVTQIITSSGMNVEEVDKEGTLAEADTVALTVENLIAIHTLIILARILILNFYADGRSGSSIQML